MEEKENAKNEKKLTTVYVNIPIAAVVAENKKSVLINSGSDFCFWLNKKHIKKPTLNEYLKIYTIVIFKEWEYEAILDLNEKLLTGQEIAICLLGSFDLYNYTNMLNSKQFLDK